MDLAGTWELGTDGATFPYAVDVPNFLIPVHWWIYSPSDFPEEQQRIDSYGYDPATLTEGWYRRVVSIPESWAGKHVELQFDGIAMYSEIRFNGTLLKSSWGMWRSHRLDVTRYVQPGQSNTISVYVKLDSPLGRYPVGQFSPGNDLASPALGIWESTRLVATEPVRVDDVFFKPGTDGAEIDVTVANRSTSDVTVRIRHRASAVGDGGALFEDPEGVALRVDAGKSAVATVTVSGIRPRLWSPDDPHLYLLTTVLENGGKVVDEFTHRVGFRTFEARGNAFYLNGKPYWLRGAGTLPTMMIGRDKIPQMRRWLTALRDENVRVSRMHLGPGASPWFDLADEIGMGVDMEGIRGFVFGHPLTSDQAREWKEEMVDVIHRLRNHPSVLLWTTGNELNAGNMSDWTVLSGINKAIRAVDSTRPLVADSLYVRNPTTYESTLKPAGIDDGDVDDAHIYWGWYDSSIFVKDVDRANGPWRPNTDRPFISGEFSTGYPDFHTGRPWNSARDPYLTGRYTPQAWVGAHAYDNDPAIFLQTHALITKETAEVLRRSRDKYRGSAGLLLFNSSTWFKEFYSGPLTPFPANAAVKLAYQPLLVSLDDFARNFYAGEQLRAGVAVVNDDMKHGDYRNLRLSWDVLDAEGRQLAHPGTTQLPSVPYHGVTRTDISIAMPEKLPAQRVAAVLRLRLEYRNTTVSENRYDIAIASRKYVAAGSAGGARTVWLYDPTGQTRASLGAVGLHYTSVDDLSGLAPGSPDLLVVGKNAVDDNVLGAGLHGYADAGGRVLILEGGSRLPQLFPEDLTGVVSGGGEVVTAVHDDSGVFAGMEPMDMRWWRHDDGSKPYVTYSSPKFGLGADNIARLGIYTQPNWLSATPSFAQRSGYPVFLKKTRPESSGYLLVSEMTTATSAAIDPLAGKLLANLLADHGDITLDPPPPSWEGFTESFEDGLDEWTVYKGSPAVTKAKAHTGTQCLGQVSGANVIYRAARAASGVVSLWFYDNAEATGTTFMARVDDNYEGGTGRWLGVHGTDSYMKRIGDTWSSTGIPRSTGWHQLSWDYTSGEGVTMAIDGKQVATVGGLSKFSVISLGDWWGGTAVGPELIDDIKVAVKRG